MRILITGGAGFVGTHTAQTLLERGHAVRILDNHTDKSSTSKSIEWVKGDICDPDTALRAVEGAEVIYHFASFNGDPACELREFVQVNGTGTACLLEAIIQSRPPLKKFILGSCSAVYGEGSFVCPSCGIVHPALRKAKDLERGDFSVCCPNCKSSVLAVPTRENRPLLPVTAYGCSKKHQEDMCQYVSKKFGLPLMVLRYFTVYGPGQPLLGSRASVVSTLCQQILGEQPVRLYEHGSGSRDFIHVSDVVKANCLALESEAGTTINVGSGVDTSISELVRTIAESVGKNPQIIDQGEFRPGDISTCYSDLRRAHRVLGYNASVTLQEGIKDLVHLLRNQKVPPLTYHPTRLRA